MKIWQKLVRLYYKAVSYRYKNLRPLFFARGLVFLLTPRAIPQKRLKRVLAEADKYDAAYLEDRVNYYNKLIEVNGDPAELSSLAEFRLPRRGRIYFFDLLEHVRFFDRRLGLDYLFGDIIHVPSRPTIVKSRPIAGDNHNSVLINLDKMRHFMFVNDPVPFEQKKDILLGRAAIWQPHRIKFYEMYFGHPMCDLGQVNNNENSWRWQVPKMTIIEHFAYKFILCLEGNDVASNLKWVMSSNSLAVMPKPKYETWFMEGRLVGGQHYVEIKDDYSDLEEKLKYYIDHPEEAKRINANANAYTRQFQDQKQEQLIALRVLAKYFEKTGQNWQDQDKGPF